MVLALCSAVALAGGPALARRAQKPTAAPALTADQREVAAQLVADAFPRPKREPLTLALCLDVQIGPATEEAPPARTKRGRPMHTSPSRPGRAVRGAPSELVARVARPWRLVSSAATCRLDADHAIALPDERHTPAQLVTVHLPAGSAEGNVSIDWTPGPGSKPSQSRDCLAKRTPRGWTVTCGGTWFE
ncbi:MAG TPA: hypothetical protein VHK47_21385 [Polyangia bacterium]|nr:hypothetical protein [Polyangia bacterium]